jgi:hypothetical protein
MIVVESGRAAVVRLELFESKVTGCREERRRVDELTSQKLGKVRDDLAAEMQNGAKPQPKKDPYLTVQAK